MYVETGYVLDRVPVELRALLPFVDLTPGPGGSRITPLVGSVRERALEILVGFWPGNDKHLLQFVALAPSSQIVAHCDPPIQGARLHVPIVTNPGSWVFSEGVWSQLEIGKCYLLDPTTEHGAVNWGTETRVHLMVDLDYQRR